ncbi:hypothetical protein Zmor_010216 [Zophobas morio]|uniref:Uncharacterized protein n=1 Tax=Zophobas morio TaxID=2755281 RepID=A0AA38IRD4_9CUCU|nr:hypothetical protein Zmor_010216 [Zophobas morio]
MEKKCTAGSHCPLGEDDKHKAGSGAIKTFKKATNVTREKMLSKNKDNVYERNLSKKFKILQVNLIFVMAAYGLAVATAMKEKVDIIAPSRASNPYMNLDGQAGFVNLKEKIYCYETNPYATPVRRLWTVEKCLGRTAMTGDASLVTRPSDVRKAWKRKSRIPNSRPGSPKYGFK